MSFPSLSQFMIQISHTTDISSISGPLEHLSTNQSVTYFLQFTVSLRQQFFFSQIANVTTITNMSSTNDTKNLRFEILLSTDIVHSKDNQIA